ncbi:hypothetical protein K466DRAFT_580619 [Polyporus arcularius HHB13444]|uniref:Uncharacterized protein n=1 Tax=Polyporus arcularius HHB13444 TaxID=1314778 RepID=A0A5C3Q5Y1_9APHY|nr:hypothetical protein K466DRAFT_580619 [Polyporus arcularius HHB13444]
MTTPTDCPMTPAPAPEGSLPDVVQPTPSTAIRKRLPWKQRKCGSSPLRQSTTPDDLARCHQCESKGRSPRAPAPLDDNRCTFGRAFLKQRAQFLSTHSSDQDYDAFRCTLYDEDPQLPVRGTPSHAEEEDQPLILPTSHAYYKYTTGKAVKRLTYVDKLDGTYFRGHSAKFARPATSSAARPLADRISVQRGVSLRLALLDSEDGDGTVTVKADDNAVATWLSHVGMIPMLHLGKLVGAEDMTTGHWVYIDETPEFSPTYSDLGLPTIPSP